MRRPKSFRSEVYIFRARWFFLSFLFLEPKKELIIARSKRMDGLSIKAVQRAKKASSRRDKKKREKTNYYY